MIDLQLKYVEADSFLDGKYDRPLYNKFIESYEVNSLQVDTPNGWVNIEKIGKTVESII